MNKYEEQLTVIIRKLVNEYGLDATIDYITGIAEDIDFENYRKILRQKEAEAEKEILNSLGLDEEDDEY